MEHLPKKIHQNGISYTLVGDYYIPDLKLPEESRPIGRLLSLCRRLYISIVLFANCMPFSHAASLGVASGQKDF